MRYSLQRNEDLKDCRPERRVTHLQNMIHIHQLRFNGKLRITFSVSGRLDAPWSFLRAYHTGGERPQTRRANDRTLRPFTLLCTISAKDHIFQSNRKERAKETSTGIGLDNTISRAKMDVCR